MKRLLEVLGVAKKELEREYNIILSSRIQTVETNIKYFEMDEEQAEEFTKYLSEVIDINKVEEYKSKMVDGKTYGVHGCHIETHRDVEYHYNVIKKDGEILINFDDEMKFINLNNFVLGFQIALLKAVNEQINNIIVLDEEAVEILSLEEYEKLMCSDEIESVEVVDTTTSRGGNVEKFVFYDGTIRYIDIETVEDVKEDPNLINLNNIELTPGEKYTMVKSDGLLPEMYQFTLVNYYINNFAQYKGRLYLLVKLKGKRNLVLLSVGNETTFIFKNWNFNKSFNKVKVSKDSYRLHKITKEEIKDNKDLLFIVERGQDFKINPDIYSFVNLTNNYLINNGINQQQAKKRMIII